MTLHKAMIIVLKEYGGEMTSEALAAELNKRKLYKKKDESEIIPYQLVGRAKQYSHLFIRDGTLIKLKK